MTERTIFLAALDVSDPAERLAYLDRACAGDAALRTQVEALLAAHAGAGSFLDVPVVQQVADAALPLAGPTPPQPESGSELPSTTIYQGRGRVPLPNEDRPLTPSGRTFGKYELLEVIARGGMGVVYKAEDTSLHRTVALKMIRSGFLASPEEVRRFRQEAQAAAALRHPNVIPIYEISEQDGYYYFTMPFVVGGSMAGRMESLRAEPRAAVALVEKIARAVHAAHAHAHGILHRDLKPANVLLDEHGEPLIADFGLAKFLDGSPGLTDTGQVVGTPSYLSPEQAAGRNDLFGPATDVWALGVLLFELFAGRRPFDSDDRGDVIHSILTEAPPTPRQLQPEFDRGLESIILKCLSKEPSQRYASAEALADDLGRWRRGEALAEDTALRTARFWTRRKLVFAVLGMLVLAGLAFTAAHLPRGDKPPAPPEAAGPSLPPPLVLIGETGPLPQQARWLRGGDKSEDVTKPGEPVSLRAEDSAEDFALLQLLEAPPWPRYRLEVEMHRDNKPAKGDSRVGLFFAHQKYVDGPVEFFGYFLATINEAEGQGGGILGRSFWAYLEAGGPGSHPRYLGGPLHLLSPASQRGMPLPWRRIAVEVTSEEFRLFQGDQLEETFAPATSKEKLPPIIFGRRAEWVPKLEGGGLGLVLTRGQDSFRNVVIKPLP
jgi:tRNA A-37 threonylcarbamoyl transferase component Bud32